jgi:hypothetical protein
MGMTSAWQIFCEIIIVISMVIRKVCLFYVLEKENRQDVSDSEDVVGERLQQDVVSRFRISVLVSRIIPRVYEAGKFLVRTVVHSFKRSAIL